MKYLTVIALFLAQSLGWANSHIMERNLFNFQNMVLTVTNRSALDYNNYGNWCGKGGKNEPVDDVDSCCRDHDKCYYALNRAECKSMFLMGVYVMPYAWTFENGVVSCSSGQSKCAEVLCHCDKTCVDCFARSEYHKENKRGWLWAIRRLIGAE